MQTILLGAALANVRILVQSGWSDISQEWFSSTAMDIEIEMSHRESNSNNNNNNNSYPSNSGGVGIQPQEQKDIPGGISRVKQELTTTAKDPALRPLKSLDSASLSSGFSKSDGVEGFSATRTRSNESDNSAEGA